MARKSKKENQGSGDRPAAPDNDNVPNAAPPGEEEYKVGPGRPPKEYQWKKGQSGNPKGAKSKQPSLLPDLREILLSAFSRKVKMTEGERERTISRWETGMEQLSVQFAKGDRYARRDVFRLLEKFGPEFLKPKTASDEALPADLQVILDAYVDRRTQGKNASASTPVLAPPELLDDDATDPDEK
jgi:Family of unknown function (DUF5681)